MANLQIRVDEELKIQAQKIAHDMGIDLTTAVRMFLKQLVNDRALPFKPGLDPFYSSTNQKVLEHSINQLSRKKIITKNLNDLMEMEK